MGRYFRSRKEAMDMKYVGFFPKNFHLFIHSKNARIFIEYVVGIAHTAGNKMVKILFLTELIL